MLNNQNVYSAEYSSESCVYSHAPQPIVIVDDSKDDSSLLLRCLKSFIPEEKPIITLRSGKELLDYLGELEMENIEAMEFEVEIPDMIFLDLMMPQMNGIQTLAAMRRQGIWSDVPVTLVTCSRDDIAIKQAEDVGANAFMPKPFTKQDVVQALHKGTNFSPTIM